LPPAEAADGRQCGGGAAAGRRQGGGSVGLDIRSDLRRGRL